MIGALTGQVLGVQQQANLSILLIDVQGVAYEVQLATRHTQFLKPGARTGLYIYTHLRADGRSEAALELFGFLTQWEKSVFLALTSVSGIGYKTALSMLSIVTADQVIHAIMRDDKKTLTSIPGIGKKTAERMVLDLQDKVQKLLLTKPELSRPFNPSWSSVASPPVNAEALNALPDTSADAIDSADTAATQPSADALENEILSDAMAALLSLGYKEFDAAQALRKSLQSQTDKVPLNLPGLITKSLQQLSISNG